MKRLTIVAAALLVAAAGSALAQEPSLATMETLRQRILGGAMGILEGRIYMEGRKPNDPSEPLVGIGVLIVPRSATLLQHLETVKQQARESVDGFREAAPATRAAMTDYETALWRLGYPDVAIRAVTDATGAFRAEVPAGSWVVFAERSVFLPIQTKQAETAPSATALDPLARYSTSQYQHFQKVAKLTGFDAVSVWLREVDVAAGRTVALELHDRGLWLSGVVEETATPRRLRIVGGGRKR
jgi:hypothetical protein